MALRELLVWGCKLLISRSFGKREKDQNDGTDINATRNFTQTIICQGGVS
jgi:hypothetical protein